MVVEKTFTVHNVDCEGLREDSCLFHVVRVMILVMVMVMVMVLVNPRDPLQHCLEASSPSFE